MKNTILIFALLALAITPKVGSGQNPEAVKKQNTALISFSYKLGSYDINQVNETRKANGVGNLKRNQNLDSLALVRCKRMAEIIKKDADLFCTDGNATFVKEGHAQRFTPENAALRIEGAGVHKDSLVTLNNEKVTKNLNKSLFGPFLAGVSYNQSEGHFNNRIDKSYKEYGSCYLVGRRTSKAYR